MKRYDCFHGEIEINNIGKVLRDITRREPNNFKILTGYGSSGVVCKSKQSAIKSLTKMKKEGLIIGFLPGEIKDMLLTSSSPYYLAKQEFQNLIKNDIDYGNDGVIFIFKKKS